MYPGVNELVKKVQDVNNMPFEKVAESIGYTARDLERIMDSNDSDDEVIHLLFAKHPNSLRGMARKSVE